MHDIDIDWHKVEYQASAALATWGYSCECTIEVPRLIMAIKVHSRNGVELDGRCKVFRFCATEALTRSASGRHRLNYYEWQEGLRKFSSANFWHTRSTSNRLRGACSDSELAYHAAYSASHRDEKRARDSAYYANHRDYRLSYLTAYREAHRDDSAAYNTKRDYQLWTNGTETLKWSTLNSRGRKLGLHKADYIAQGWHPIE